MSNLNRFNSLEAQLRAALNGPEEVATPSSLIPKVTKPVDHKRLKTPTAHIVVSGCPAHGGHPVIIDYRHDSISMFEAELIVAKLAAKQKLRLVVAITKEVNSDY